MHMRVGGKVLTVPRAGSRVERVHGRTTHPHRRKTGVVLAVRIEGSTRRRLGGGGLGVRAVLVQQFHRRDVERVRSPPEGRRAGRVHAEEVEVVREEPDMPVHRLVRVRTREKERLHELEVADLLPQVILRLRIERTRRPLEVDRRPER